MSARQSARSVYHRRLIEKQVVEAKRVALVNVLAGDDEEFRAHLDAMPYAVLRAEYLAGHLTTPELPLD